MKIWKKAPKLGYFNKTAEIFNTVLTAEGAKKLKGTYKIHLSFLLYFRYITLDGTSTWSRWGSSIQGALKYDMMQCTQHAQSCE